LSIGKKEGDWDVGVNLETVFGAQKRAEKWNKTKKLGAGRTGFLLEGCGQLPTDPALAISDFSPESQT